MNYGIKKWTEITLCERLITVVLFCFILFDLFYVVLILGTTAKPIHILWYFIVAQILIFFSVFSFFNSWIKKIDVLPSKLSRILDGDVGVLFFDQDMGSDVKEIGGLLDEIFSRHNDTLHKMEDVRLEVEKRLFIMRESLLSLEKGSIIGNDSVRKTTEGMGNVKKAIEKISSEIQSMLVSVGNTVYSVQVMENSIAKVDTDAQNMGNFVEKTSSSIEQMAKSIEEVGKNVENTSSLAKTASGSASQGSKVVRDLIDAITQISVSMNEFSFTMGELGKRSKEIGKITATIDDIAEQTNLLALNAAIEASRAGEQGKGFAVVASEIKKLAQKTSNATKEITRMIKSMQQDTNKVIQSVEKGDNQVRTGVVLADMAGDSLNIIVETIEQVSRLISEINKSTTEQGHASQQIIKAVATMRDLTGAVTASTKQQYENSQLITDVVVDMQKVTMRVVEMLEVQSAAIERVYNSVDRVRDTTALILGTMTEMEKFSASLKAIVAIITALLKRYRL